MKLKNVDLKKLQAEIEPGPWKFGRHQMAIYSVPSGRTICATPVFLNADAEANAQAIALVPEMIARILKLEAYMRNIRECLATRGDERKEQLMAFINDENNEASAAFGMS